MPAERPITVQDVLSFRLGFGAIMDPGPYPVQRAESELGLKTLGPCWPPADLTSDEWIARLGSLPLLDQPGTHWRYNTGGSVAGVLIERVTGMPLGDVLAERIFTPLGMTDTGFYVPAGKLGRFTTFYRPDASSGELQFLDRPGGRLFSAESVRQMTRDRMTARDRADNQVFLGDHSGWGLMMAVPAADGSAGVPGGFGWDGGSGTTWRTDLAAGRTGILLTQRMATSPEPTQLVKDFWSAAYAA